MAPPRTLLANHEYNLAAPFHVCYTRFDCSTGRFAFQEVRVLRQDRLRSLSCHEASPEAGQDVAGTSLTSVDKVTAIPETLHENAQNKETKESIL